MRRGTRGVAAVRSGIASGMDRSVDKSRVLEALRARVRTALEGLVGSQRATQAGAVHEETRAEDPKDTRATEASYLARGLAQRVEELEHASALLAAIDIGDHDEDRSIGIGALVGLEDADGDESIVFVVPAGGGEKLEVDGALIRPVTPSSPLGAAVIGSRLDDEIEVSLPGGRQHFTIEWIR